MPRVAVGQGDVTELKTEKCQNVIQSLVLKPFINSLIALRANLD